MTKMACWVSLFFIIAPALGADAPTIESVWTKPEAPIRGKTIDFMIVGSGFNPTSVSAEIFGPAPCEAGCNLDLKPEPRTANLLTGSRKLDLPGAYSVRVKNGDGTPTDKKKFCLVNPAKIGRILTHPDTPVAGVPFEISIAGTGFDPGSLQVVLTNFSSQTDQHPVSLDEPRGADFVSGRSNALPPGRYRVNVWNTGDSQVDAGELQIPAPQIKQFVTYPSPPSGGVPFDYVLVGSDLASEQIQFKVYVSPSCMNGCYLKPNEVSIAAKSPSVLVGQMRLPGPAQYQLCVVSAGILSSPCKPVAVK